MDYKSIVMGCRIANPAHRILFYFYGLKIIELKTKMETVKSKTLQEGARKRRLTCQDLSTLKPAQLREMDCKSIVMGCRIANPAQRSENPSEVGFSRIEWGAFRKGLLWLRRKGVAFSP